MPTRFATCSAFRCRRTRCRPRAIRGMTAPPHSRRSPTRSTASRTTSRSRRRRTPPAPPRQPVRRGRARRSGLRAAVRSRRSSPALFRRPLDAEDAADFAAVFAKGRDAGRQLRERRAGRHRGRAAIAGAPVQGRIRRGAGAASGGRSGARARTRWRRACRISLGFGAGRCADRSRRPGSAEDEGRRSARRRAACSPIRARTTSRETSTRDCCASVISEEPALDFARHGAVGGRRDHPLRRSRRLDRSRQSRHAARGAVHVRRRKVWRSSTASPASRARASSG